MIKKSDLIFENIYAISLNQNKLGNEEN